jgi:hypothetical protein
MLELPIWYPKRDGLFIEVNSNQHCGNGLNAYQEWKQQQSGRVLQLTSYYL